MIKNNTKRSISYYHYNLSYHNYCISYCIYNSIYYPSYISYHYYCIYYHLIINKGSYIINALCDNYSIDYTTIQKVRIIPIKRSFRDNNKVIFTHSILIFYNRVGLSYYK